MTPCYRWPLPRMESFSPRALGTERLRCGRYGKPRSRIALMPAAHSPLAGGAHPPFLVKRALKLPTCRLLIYFLLHLLVLPPPLLFSLSTLTHSFARHTQRQVRSGEALVNFDGAHPSGVLALDFSKDGSQLLSGSYDTTARLHGLRSERMLREFRGHASYVTQVLFRFAPLGGWW